MLNAARLFTPLCCVPGTPVGLNRFMNNQPDEKTIVKLMQSARVSLELR